VNVVNSGKAGNRIGLFGGSFDPPHMGHVALVEAGLDVLGLDEVWVIPAMPVHRELSGCVDAETRLRWLEMIFESDHRIKVLDWEIRRNRPTAMVETLREFVGKHAATVPWLMLGADAWTNLADWREYPAHRELCNVAVFARQGMDRESLPELPGWKQVDMQGWQKCECGGHMLYVAVELPDISATALRRDIMKTEELTDSIPAAIYSEVQQAYSGLQE
jgi:nicotinate-nucleotide adenylyltransferase